jgi:deoxyadenosine/deoxycytidine kinase
MNQPTLIVIGGFAGAGKTTIATKLSAKYNYPIFSSDTINDAMRPVLQKSFHEVSPMAYQVMWYLIQKQLKAGVTLILDSNMCNAKVWDRLDMLRHDMPSIQILPIILQCSLDTHRARIEERGRTNKEHLNLGGDSLEDVLFKYEFIEELQRPDLIRIDANGEPEKVYESVENLLQARLS